MKQYLKPLLFILLLLLAAMPLQSHAQEKATELKEIEWKRLTNDEAFGYKDETEAITKPKEDKPQDYSFMVKIFQAIGEFFSSPFMKVLLWIAIFALVAWIIYRLAFQSTLFQRKVATVQGDSVTIDTEDLMDTNWETKLQDAIQNGNTQLAVRYAYMWLLQMLQRRDLINYTEEKTNHEYYRELYNTEYKKDFGQLTRQYEYAWYGEYPLTAESYEHYMQTFKNIRTKLRY